MSNIREDLEKVLLNLDAARKEIKNAVIVSPIDRIQLESDLKNMLEGQDPLLQKVTFMGFRVFEHSYFPQGEVLLIDTVVHALEVIGRLDELQSKKWPWQMALVPARMEP